MAGLKEMLASALRTEAGAPSLNLESLLESAKKLAPSLSSVLGPEQQKLLAGLETRLPELVSAGRKGASFLARSLASRPDPLTGVPSGVAPTELPRVVHRQGANSVATTGVVSLAAVTGLTAVAGVVSAVALARRK